MGWIKRLLRTWTIARTIVKCGSELMVEAAQVRNVYLAAIDASSEGGRKVTKSEWQKLAGEGFDVLALIFSWKK